MVVRLARVCVCVRGGEEGDNGDLWTVGGILISPGFKAEDHTGRSAIGHNDAVLASINKICGYQRLYFYLIFIFPLRATLVWTAFSSGSLHFVKPAYAHWMCT